MMGRPKLDFDVMVIRTAITLRPGEDDDLIKIFCKIPARKISAYIKAGLRSGVMVEPVTDGLPEDDELMDSLADFLM